MARRPDQAQRGAIGTIDYGIDGRDARTGRGQRHVVRRGADDGIRVELTAAIFGNLPGPLDHLRYVNHSQRGRVKRCESARRATVAQACLVEHGPDRPQTLSRLRVSAGVMSEEDGVVEKDCHGCLNSGPDRFQLALLRRRRRRLFGGLGGYVGFSVQDVPGRVLHALRPNVKAAMLPWIFLGRGNLPRAPDAFALVEALVEHVVLTDVALRPMASPVGRSYLPRMRNSPTQSRPSPVSVPWRNVRISSIAWRPGTSFCKKKPVHVPLGKRESLSSPCGSFSSMSASP